MNVAVIDIGSNTVKASVYKIIGKNRRIELGYKGYKDALITCIDGNGNVTQEGINRLSSTIEKLILFSKEFDCDNIYAFATAALRKAKNASEIISLIDERYGILVDVLSESEEAIYSLKGLLSSPELGLYKNGIMVDMGGGSTEIVMFENGRAPILKSFCFGCLSLIDAFCEGGEPTKTYISDISQYVKKELQSFEVIQNSNLPLFLIGGTARAVLKISNFLKGTSFNFVKSDGSDFKTIFEKCEESDFKSILSDIIPERSKTVVSGSVAYYEIVKYIAPVSVVVSDSGVREGYLERILP